MRLSLKQIMGILTLLAAGIFTGCATHTVKSTAYTPVKVGSQSVPEELLLDVGVSIFDPGLDELSDDQEELTNGQVRVAESRYVPYLLSDTLQRSANWGIVRLLPNDSSPMDVKITGTLLESNGEAMAMRIEVVDSRGVQWFVKEYEEVISRFNYEATQRQKNDPFQVIYNKIANDLLAYRERNLNEQDIREIRTVSEILFAQRFSEEVFSGYLSRNRNGHLQLNALPAVDDPLLNRIQDIRERDFMFIDTVQDYYATYCRQMRLPYDSWREQSYQETVTLRELRDSARRRFIAGTAAVVGGIAAATQGGNYGTQASGAVGVGAGAYLIKSGFDRQNEARMHMEAMEELGQSLEDAVAPQVITLDDRTITLSGTVEEQYAQWRDILADLYAEELGQL
ncbi:MAG: hypothetical protein OXE78_02535 [Gammaproteobacteria bacterium]|nr:hypothetical protein [Gammaproteobacteria bacterium]MCY4358967.1 hypothetical protein [Gammaproteobacteria bacterium]